MQQVVGSKILHTYLSESKGVAKMKFTVHVRVREGHKVRLVGVGFSVLQHYSVACASACVRPVRD